MYKVSIIGAKFFGYHGVFPEEKVIGNWYTVDATVTVDGKPSVDDIKTTIDYQKVFDILRGEMGVSVDLLETLLINIESKFSELGISSSEILIKKHAPPVGGQVDFSQVERKTTY